MAALTDTKLRALKPRPAVYRVADMLGLCIEVRPTGFKAWRFRYRFGGKGRMLDLGTYPQMSLQDARKERDRQRDVVAKGIDPADVRRHERPESRFEVSEKRSDVICPETSVYVWSKFTGRRQDRLSSQRKGRAAMNCTAFRQHDRRVGLNACSGRHDGKRANDAGVAVEVVVEAERLTCCLGGHDGGPQDLHPVRGIAAVHAEMT